METFIFSDLEFSDDEEDFGGRRPVEMEGDLAAGMVLEEGQYINPQGPDETQGAAEAMVQLAAQYSYYQVNYDACLNFIQRWFSFLNSIMLKCQLVLLRN